MSKQIFGDHTEKDYKDEITRKLEAVTGKGLRSDSGVPVLRLVVLQTFVEEFSPSIACPKNDNNSGRVVVSASEILKMDGRISLRNDVKV